MALFEGESTKVIDKFNGENFNLWKFTMEMVLASMDLWEIIDGSEEAPPSYEYLITTLETFVRISCTLPPLRYALTKNPVRSGTTM
jgi:hypothetical protein